MPTVTGSALRTAGSYPSQLAVAAAALSKICNTNEHQVRQDFYDQNQRRLHPTYVYLLCPITDEEIENAKQSFIITYQQFASTHPFLLRHTKRMWEQGRKLRLDHHKLAFPIPTEAVADARTDQEILQHALIGHEWSMFGKEALSILYVFEMCKPSNSDRLGRWETSDADRSTHADLLDRFINNVTKVMRRSELVDRFDRKRVNA